MKSFKVATWNVNSLRVRLPHVLTWLESAKPDVLALQETKVIDADFPYLPLQEAGYAAIYSGQKTYNGVALLINKSSHQENINTHLTEIPQFADQERRVLGVSIGDIFFLDLYIPNGESVTSTKYQYKLNWLKKLEEYLHLELKKHPKLIMLGDFNIAPDEIDVDDPKKWQGQVLFSEPERKAFRHFIQLGFQDCFRLMNPSVQQFSWWDYRMNAFKRNLGLRIDHILASTALASFCTTCSIDPSPRAWERPSDHTPVIAEFNF